MKKIKEEKPKGPITTVQIEKTAITAALADVSKFGKGVFIVAGDPETDQLFAFFNGKFIPAQIKGNDGESIQLVKKVLEYNDDEHAVNSFLHFIDGVMFAFAESLKKDKLKLKVAKTNKKAKKK